MVNETDPIKILQLVEISSKIVLIICFIEHVVSSTLLGDVGTKHV